MTVAGRRLRDRPGPDGAPRGDGLDVRWSADYLYIVTSHPDARPYLWGLAAAIYDQSRRNPDELNPFWRDDPGDARVSNLQPSAPVGAALAGVRRNHLRPLLRDAAGGRGERPAQGIEPGVRPVPRLDPHETPFGRVARLSPLGEPMNDALNVLPPKVRAGIYLLLIVANAVIVPLMAAGQVPSLYGTIVLALLGVFGGATALANVQKSYDAKHDEV